MALGKQANRLAGSCAAFIASVLACSAYAIDPAYIEAQPFYIQPTLLARVGYNDNIYANQNVQVSDTVRILRPRLQAWLNNDANTYSVAVEAINTRYRTESKNDATDYKLNLDIHQVINNKNVLDLYAEVFQTHENLGNGFTEGDIALELDTPVKYHKKQIGGIYNYGTPEADTRFTLEARRQTYESQNYREYTAYRDRTQDRLSGTVFYQVASKTSAFVRLTHGQTDYNDDIDDATAGTLDSTENSWVAGLAWAATGKTSGSVGVGSFKREFDDPSRASVKGSHWDMAVNWSPKSYSQVDAVMRRRSHETYGVGDFVNSKEYSLRWNHFWAQRFSHNIYVRLSDDTYEATTRQDDRLDAGITLTYAFRRWFDLALGYSYHKRTTNADNLDFNRNVYFLEVKLSL
ncbi:MAG: outer membrane beta-barrel protein [Pseudomonadales bacterium]